MARFVSRDIWEDERHITDALEGIALLVRVITAQAGVTLAQIEPRSAPASRRLRHSGRDQRWRGASPAPAVELSA